MAESKLLSAQKALNTCTDHEHEEVEMYCRTCGKAVCTKCVKGEHKDHEWETIMKIAKDLRKQSNQQKLELDSVSKSILAGIGEALEYFTSEANGELSSNCSRLDSNRRRVIHFVNKSFGKMISKCRSIHKQKMDYIQEQTKKLKSKGTRVRFLIQHIEIGVKDYTDLDLIELFHTIKQLLSELKILATLPDELHKKMKYIPGSFDEGTLKLMIGSVEACVSAPKIKFENKFKVSDTKINSIHLLSENKAWVHPILTTTNQIVVNSGKLKKSVDIGCRIYNFAVSGEHVMYFCDFEKQLLKKLDYDGKITSLFSTSPLIPIGVNLTRSRDLLLTLVDKNLDYRHTSSKRILRRATFSGEVIKEYGYDSDGITPLFCKPLKPIEHSDGSIGVVDVFINKAGKYSGTVFGFDCTGSVTYRYNGIDDHFNPLDICCDIEGHTFITDCSSRRIHIIDSNGTFVRFLLTKEILTDTIYAIALFGRKIWIGNFETGIIKVFKFEYP